MKYTKEMQLRENIINLIKMLESKHILINKGEWYEIKGVYVEQFIMDLYFNRDINIHDYLGYQGTLQIKKDLFIYKVINRIITHENKREMDQINYWIDKSIFNKEFNKRMNKHKSKSKLKRL